MRSPIEFGGVALSKRVPEVAEYQPGEFWGRLENGYKPREIMARAVEDWQDALVEADLIEEVARIVEASEGGKSRDEIKGMLGKIKLLRKPGTRLVDIHKLVLAAHRAPEALSNLVDAIGDFKDFAIYPMRVRAAGEKLVGLAEAYGREEADLTEFASFESFHTTYQGYLDDIEKFLGMENPTLHFFHKLRYRVRTLRHYFTVLSLATGDVQAAEISKLLGPVSVEMGKIQDEVIKLRVKGEIDIHTDATMVPEIHRQIILAFLALHN